MALDPRPASWTTWGILIAVTTIPATLALAAAEPQITLAGTLLLLLLEVVIVALLANIVVAVLAALAAVAGANYFLTEPYYTFVIADPADIIALTVFVTTAIAASVLITWVLRQRETAIRSQAETATYRALMTAPTSETSPEPALRTLIDILGLYEVELRDPGNQSVAQAAGPLRGYRSDDPDATLLDEELPDGYRLLGTGPVITGADYRIIRSLGAAAVRSEQRRLTL